MKTEPSNEHLSQRLAEIFKELPERERLIVALYYYENLDLDEIAGIMNMTEVRVTAIMTKTLTELRAKMQDDPA